MDWLIIGGLAVIATAYMMGKTDSMTEGWRQGINFMEQKEQARAWMEQMARHLSEGEDDEDEET